ncbi:tRNA threonylcarbamoyladenosine dehydratase [Desulfofalx alkaliphila]|uniref:tRNA threonylcarbamoyladenosine dehydratase n=1 Tax=Desulfofalx alkaliphila TaxID=105483 RepID=UPI0005580B34|nr:tRNA threonylcarbamoyladenosine dehydratase [Desulfofalx alkaliphila]
MGLHRFSRTELIIGSQGLHKLKCSKVAVFGVGGVGSYTVEALARAGVGHLLLVDSDDVCLTNINRQIHALDNTVGQAKVKLMADRVKLINPDIKVEAVKEFYTPENGSRFVTSDIDYVVDAIDNVRGKLDLIKRCVENKIPIAAAMGAGNKLDAGALRQADISETSVCPLAKVVRRELKKAGIFRGVKVVYSTEQPIKPVKSGQNTDGRQVPGSISFVPGVAGLMLASIVVNDLIHNLNKSENLEI